MPYHSKAKAEKLHKALQERLDGLVTAMYGTDVREEDARLSGYHGNPPAFSGLQKWS